jgi:hypothetical protein
MYDLEDIDKFLAKLEYDCQYIKQLTRKLYEKKTKEE